MSAHLTSSVYTALRHVITVDLEAGKKRAQETVEPEKIHTGWEIGKLLHQHLLKNKDRAEHGERVIGQLSDDLGMRERRLYEMLTFYQAFPILRTCAEFNFTPA